MNILTIINDRHEISCTCISRRFWQYVCSSNSQVWSDDGRKLLLYRTPGDRTRNHSMYIKLSSPFVSSNVVICKQKHVFGDDALTIKYSARNTAFHSIKRLVEERIAQEFYINFNNTLLTIRIAFCKTLTHYIHNLQCGSHIYNCWQIKCKKDRQTVISNYVLVFYF